MSKYKKARVSYMEPRTIEFAIFWLARNPLPFTPLLSSQTALDDRCVYCELLYPECDFAAAVLLMRTRICGLITRWLLRLVLKQLNPRAREEPRSVIALEPRGQPAEKRELVNRHAMLHPAIR